MKHFKGIKILIYLSGVMAFSLIPSNISGNRVMASVPVANIRDEYAQRQGPVFSLKIIKPVVNMREGPGVSYKYIGSVEENDLLAGIAHEDGWYLCRTPEGTEGWIIDWACELVPIHSDIAQDEKSRAVIKGNGVAVRAGPDESYPILSEFSMGREVGVYLEDGGWVYIKEPGSKTEGWITSNSISDSKGLIDIYVWKEEVLKIANKLSDYYDMKKAGLKSYQDAGWYPSFRILGGENDIYIDPLAGGWSLELTFSLRKISIDTLFPLSVETVPISLSRSDLFFFLTLIQALMENPACEEVKIRLKGLKKKKFITSLKWATVSCFVASRSALSDKDLDKIDPNAFWDLLKKEAI